MSVEEIRQQKALALLEFQEAQEGLNKSESAIESFTAKLKSLAAAMTSAPESISPQQMFPDLSIEAASNLLEERREARIAWQKAAEKKKQFGL